MAIRGRLFRHIYSFILAFSILFLSIPLNTAAEEFGDVSADISSPVAENSIQTGTSIYRIPIEVPPGRRGIAPNIALVYNSAQGGGWAGTGWGLDMGSIQRSTKRGVNYTDNNYVAVINGSAVELVYRSGDWGPGYYSAKIEGAFFKFHHIIEGDDNYWEVTAKDGTKYYYGRRASTYTPLDESTWENGGFNSEASRQTNPYYPQETGQIFKWLLDKVVDTNGNYMKITYANDKGSLYLQEIKYTGYGVLGSNDYIAPANKVVFTKSKDANDITRLTYIEVFADGNLVRKYDLFYNNSDYTDRPLLKKIFLYGSDDLESTKRLISSFTYQTTPLLFEDPVGFLPSTSGKTIVSGDFNGDARSDIALIDSSGVRVHLSQGSSFINDGEWLSSISSAYDCQPNLGCFTEYEGHSGDFDGDGKADLVIATRYKDETGNYFVDEGGNILASAYVYYSDGTSFPAQELFSTGALLKLSVGDVNGDGRADIVSGSGASLSQGRSFSGTVACDLAFSACLLNPISQSWAGDFNGDGKSDIVRHDMVQYSSGSTFIPAAGSPNFPSFSDNVVIGDFNGDGRADIADVLSNGVYIHLSKSKGFKAPAQWVSDASTFAVAGDFNGDGKSDLLVQGASGNATVYYSKGGIPDLLKTVQNEIGGTTTIAYLPSTNYVNTYLPYVTQTVSSITTSDGAGNAYEKTFTYSGGYFAKGDREFRGFDTATQTNPDNTSSTTYFYQGLNESYCANPEVDPKKCDKSFKGMPYYQVTTDSSGITFSDTYNAYEKTLVYTNVYFPHLKQKNDRLYDGLSAPKETALSFDYDNYGNVIRKVSHGEVLAGQTTTGDEKTECVNYYNDPVIDSPQVSKWMVSLPKSTRIYEGVHDCGDSGEPKAKSEFTYYYPSGNLWTKTGWLKDEWGNNINLTATYGYDVYGNQTSIADAKGNTTTIDYCYNDTTCTYPTKTINALLHEATATYDHKYGKPLTKTDANGNTTTYVYDTFGRPSKAYGPGDSETYPTTTYAYQYSGDVNTQYVQTCSRIKSGEAADLCKETYFDGLGRTTYTVADAPENKSVTTKTEYDDYGRVWRKSLPYFLTEPPTPPAQPTQWTTFTYDAMGRPWKVTSPDGTYSEKTYSQLITTMFNANRHKREEEKDVYGRLYKVREYVTEDVNGTPTLVANETKYEYDILNNLRFVTDAQNNVTTVNYDTLSRKTSMTDPDMGHWTYKYDANGNLTEQTDAKGQIITFDYDVLNRVSHKYYPSGTPVTYTYDVYDNGSTTNAKGRLTKVVDASGSNIFYYDQLGRATSTEKTINGVSYSPTQASFSFSTAYDALGRTTSVTYPDNEVVKYHYDAGALLNVTDNSETLKYVEYTGFNALGQVSTVNYGNTVKTGYTYYEETNHRLKTIQTYVAMPVMLQDMAYEYDNVGNIRSISDSLDTGPVNASSASHNYPTNGIRPHAISDSGYSYDNNGNMTGAPDKTIIYNYDNMPISITKGSNTATFVYDYSGQRVMKNNNTVYIGKLYECTVDTITGICINAKKHIFAGDKRIATKTASNTYYYHADHLGSTSLITDENAVVQETKRYYPFGESRYSSGDSGLNYLFTGQEEDPEIGLYYYGARYYDPALGKFISPDSIVQAPYDPQTLNRYAYALNNPLRYTDPTGHFVPQLMAIGLVVGGFMAGVQNDWDMGAMIQGAVLGGLGGMLGGIAPTNLIAVVVAGAVSGGLSAAVYGGNIGEGMFYGAVGAAAGYGAGSLLKSVGNDLFKFAARTASGGLISGGISELRGGSFYEGFAAGAIGAAMGYGVGKLMEHLDQISFNQQFEQWKVAVEEAAKNDDLDRALAIYSPSAKGYAGFLLMGVGGTLFPTGFGAALLVTGAALTLWDVVESGQDLNEIDKKLNPARDEMRDLQKELDKNNNSRR